jgi:hypothetical protein
VHNSIPLLALVDDLPPILNRRVTGLLMGGATKMRPTGVHHESPGCSRVGNGYTVPLLGRGRPEVGHRPSKDEGLNIIHSGRSSVAALEVVEVGEKGVRQG